MKKPWIRWLLGVVVVGVVIGSALVRRSSSYHGSDVTWSELLAAAQKVDPQAVLIKVTVIPEKSLLIPSSEHRLSIYFTFRQSSSTVFAVSFDDTQPQETISLHTSNEPITATLAITQQQTYVANLSQVVLSPADIIDRTFLEGKPYLEDGQVSENPRLTLVLDPSTIEGVATSHAVWRINYIAVFDRLILYVDAVTGEVIKRQTMHGH